MAAWLLHSYAFDAAETTPYIHITAPEKACGKSYLMEALSGACSRAHSQRRHDSRRASRTIHAKKPTIFLDEMDAQLGGNKEYAEAVRGILNEGFRKGGHVLQMQREPPMRLKSSTPIVQSASRESGSCLTLLPAAPSGLKCDGSYLANPLNHFRQKAVKNAALPIKAKLEAWEARGAADLLCPIEPAPIASLSDRQNDIAEPLLCIAQLGGNGWLQRLTVALQAVFKAASVEDGSLGVTCAR